PLHDHDGRGRGGSPPDRRLGHLRPSRRTESRRRDVGGRCAGRGRGLSLLRAHQGQRHGYGRGDTRRRRILMADRTAHVTWTGSLMEGAGRITSVDSGAFGPLDVTWASRTEDSDGRTSPEELIAAAHAACFSMALSHGLAEAGTPPERLDTSAVVTFEPGVGITKIVLTVRG